MFIQQISYSFENMMMLNAQFPLHKLIELMRTSLFCTFLTCSRYLI